VRKYLPIALAVAALATVGAAPASARTVHHPVTRYSDPLSMYAPNGWGSEAAPVSPDYSPYPNPIPRTGTQENRSEWDPTYVPTAPN